MKQFTDIRNCILGLSAALLILVQSVFAAGLSYSYTGEKASTSPSKTEVKQEVIAKANFVVADSRVTLANFLFFWLLRVFTVDAPLIAYLNCEAFFIHPHSFNIYYTCLSALAP